MKTAFSHLQAIGLALAAYTFWVLADTNLKLVAAAALPAQEVIAILGLAQVILLFVYTVWRRDLQSLRPRNLRFQLLRSILDLVNQFGVVIALRHLPLALFYILIFLAPMVTALLAALFLSEPVEWKRALAIAIGFLGVVVAVLPFDLAGPGELTGYLACLVCVACFSTNLVSARVLTQTESTLSLTFSSALIMALVGSAATLRHATPVSTRIILILAVTGLFCVAGSLCFFAALRQTSVATVAQYHYTQLLTGAILAYLFLHEAPPPSMLFGAVLILLAGFYAAALPASRPSVAKS